MSRCFPDPVLHGVVGLLVSTFPAEPVVESGDAHRVALAADDVPHLVAVARSHTRQSRPTSAVVEQQKRLGSSQTLLVDTPAALGSLEGVAGSLAARSAVPVPARLRLRLRIVGCRNQPRTLRMLLLQKTEKQGQATQDPPPAVLETQILEQIYIYIYIYIYICFFFFFCGCLQLHIYTYVYDRGLPSPPPPPWVWVPRVQGCRPPPPPPWVWVRTLPPSPLRVGVGVGAPKKKRGNSESKFWPGGPEF